jgi:hypothetical protein
MSPLVRTGSFFYERALDENKSVQLGFFYSGISVEDTRFRGFGITPEFRLYLSEKRQAPAGIFVAPYLRYQNFDLSYGDVASATYSSTWRRTPDWITAGALKHHQPRSFYRSFLFYGQYKDCFWATITGTPEFLMVSECVSG